MSPQQEVELTRDNIEHWPNFQKLLNEGKVKFDSLGKLRYLHGAPVGKLVVAGTSADGTPVYKESSTEWFDPDSPKAREFEWP